MSLRQFTLILTLTLSAFISAEGLTRHQSPAPAFDSQKVPSLEKTLKSLANLSLEGREIDNRFTIHNIAKFSRHPNPNAITTTFLGTSRTKLLQPKFIGWDNAIVSAGNSYNEISYSYLIEAIALKQLFPNLDTIFVEASLLNQQKPAPTFIVSPDHQKYLPILATMQPGITQSSKSQEYSQSSSAQNIALMLSQQATQQQQAQPHTVSLGPWQIKHPPSQLFDQRDKFKLSTLLNVNERQQRLPIEQADVFKHMEKDGSVPFKVPGNNGQLVPTYRIDNSPISADNPKVTRLADITSHYPWSDQYQALADWATRNGVTLIFFQPPVRSDFYAFQKQYGLALHRQEMGNIADRTGFHFIDLNMQSLGYGDDWTLFSDADHLGTCEGITTYLWALKIGTESWQRNPTAPSKISLSAARKKANQTANSCS